MGKGRYKELKFKGWDISKPLPKKPEPNTVYIVKDGLHFEMFPVDADCNYLRAKEQEIPDSSIFGSDFNLFRSQSVTTNLTDTPEEVINQTTGDLRAGVYTVKVDYSWNSNCTQHDFEAYLLVDGASITADPTGLIHKEEPKDSAGNWNSTGSLQVLPFSREFILDVNSFGPKDVVLSFRSSEDNIAASIWDVSIKIYRLS